MEGGVDVHRCLKKHGWNVMQLKELEIQQGLLVDLHANANMILQHLDKYYIEENNKRQRPTSSDEVDNDETAK